jgi:hypothetical protein
MQSSRSPSFWLDLLMFVEQVRVCDLNAILWVTNSKVNEFVIAPTCSFGCRPVQRGCQAVNYPEQTWSCSPGTSAGLLGQVGRG